MGWSGSIVLADGRLWGGSVRLPDERTRNLRELLADLAQPGLCLILGAGASHGVIPISNKEIAAVAWEVVQAQGRFSVLPTHQREQLDRHPELHALIELLKEFPPDTWDRLLEEIPDMLTLGRTIGTRSGDMDRFMTNVPDVLSPAQATVIWDGVFSPRTEIPNALIDIYSVLENRDGVVVCYNYDRIIEGQRRFPVIFPHGQRPMELRDPRTGKGVREMAWDFHTPVKTDWHLTLPEDDQVRERHHYRKALSAWRQARCVVFVGYAFGRGADALSFEDFSKNVARDARIHVLCPPPDNADLCKQIGSGIHGRPGRFRIFGQPFRWRSFADAILALLGQLDGSHIGAIRDRELDLIARHDRC